MKRSALTILLALLASAALAAEPVANEVCLTCHEHATTGNPNSPHFKAPVRCESCHGDGAKHAESGDPKLIRSFKGKPAAEACTSCHQDQHVAEWKASRHHEVGWIARIATQCIRRRTRRRPAGVATQCKRYPD